MRKFKSSTERLRRVAAGGAAADSASGRIPLCGRLCRANRA